jgi:hypothetical protein
VTELYCLVCPGDQKSAVRQDPFLTLQQAMQVASRSVQAQFAAAYGEALLAITEYLVEDVLLVSSGGASLGPDTSTNTTSTTTSSSSSSNTKGAAAAKACAADTQAAHNTTAMTAAIGKSQHGTPEAQPSSSGTARRSSSGGRRRPRAGGRNSAVTLENHRVWWAQDTVTTISLLIRRDGEASGAPAQAGESAEAGGEQAGARQTHGPLHLSKPLPAVS